MTGEYIGKSTNGVLPNITGSFGNGAEYRNPGNLTNATGAFSSLGTAYGRDSDGGGSGRAYGLSFDASRCSSIYGHGWYDGTKVIPAGSGVSYIIKY